MARDLRRLYRRLRFGRPIVVVSGLPRSGTSLVMQMLAAGGLPIVTDGARSPDEDNPRGYLEDQRVKDLGRSDARWLAEARGKAVKVVSHLLKELPRGHNYQVILVLRDIREVLTSQARMLERRGEPSGPDNSQMRELLEGDLWRARYLLSRLPQFDVLELSYADVIEQPERHARRVAGFLGMPLDVAAMAAVVDRMLYRNRAQPVTSDTASRRPPRP
jgi:hypothetical protein